MIEYYLKLTSFALANILLCVGIYVVIEIIRLTSKVRKLITRFEYITDISSWLNLIRKWPRKSKKSVS